MIRFAARCAALLCTLAIPSAVSLTLPSAALATTGTITGRVIDVEGGTFTVQTAGRRMGVINALIASANRVAAGDYPYVWGGGHAQAGVASVGISGPGHNGRRTGFDCSGSVAAVLAGAGIWRWGSGVPSDAGVISELRAQGLIAGGPGRAPSEVTLYDDPGVHIFMNIDGRFFGTSDGGGGGNRRGGAGWLYDGAWDATSRAFRQYHILPGVLKDRTSYGHDFTFSDGSAAPLTAGLLLGDRVRVSFAQNAAGAMNASELTWVDGLTAQGTVLAVSPDGSSFQLQVAGGRTLTLSTGAFPNLLQGASAGAPVSVIYTRHAGVLLARSVDVVGGATTGEASGVVSSIAADGSSFTVELGTGQTETFSTGGDTAMLSGVAAGDSVQVAYFQTASGALVAQQLSDQGPGAGPGGSAGTGSSAGTSGAAG